IQKYLFLMMSMVMQVVQELGYSKYSHWNRNLFLLKFLKEIAIYTESYFNENNNPTNYVYNNDLTFIITDSLEIINNITFDHWNLDTIELQEEFKILLLNRANEILGIHTLSKGSMTGTLVDLRLLFAVVI